MPSRCRSGQQTASGSPYQLDLPDGSTLRFRDDGTAQKLIREPDLPQVRTIPDVLHYCRYCSGNLRPYALLGITWVQVPHVVGPWPDVRRDDGDDDWLSRHRGAGGVPSEGNRRSLSKGPSGLFLTEAVERPDSSWAISSVRSFGQWYRTFDSAHIFTFRTRYLPAHETGR